MNSEEKREDMENNNIIIKEDEFDKRKLEDSQERQMKWALFLMGGLLILIVAVALVNTYYFDKFNYHGLKFQRTQLGEIKFYSTRFPVIAQTGQVIGEYAVNLRNDPRKIEIIPVDVEDNEIKFNVIKKNNKSQYAPTYISIFPFMDTCEDSGIALLTLSTFLRDSGLEVSSAVTDKAYANKNNQTHKWCDPLNTVIVVNSGEENIISEIQPYCYEIKFKDCEILPVSERFILNLLEQYGERFERN